MFSFVHVWFVGSCALLTRVFYLLFTYLQPSISLVRYRNSRILLTCPRGKKRNENKHELSAYTPITRNSNSLRKPIKTICSKRQKFSLPSSSFFLFFALSQVEIFTTWLHFGAATAWHYGGRVGVACRVVSRPLFIVHAGPGVNVV